MSRIIVEDRFEQFGAAFDNAVKTGITETAREARAILALSFPGTIGAAARVGPVEGLPLKGWRGSAYIADFRATILDKGTLGKHRGRLKGTRRDTWSVRRPTGTVTAHRHTEALESGGIAPRGYSRQVDQQIRPVFERNLARELAQLR